MQLMEPPDKPAAGEGGEVIAHLRQTVLAWMDGDRVLPADGSSLLAMLDQALDGLTAAGAPAGRAGIEALSSQVKVLIEERVLEADDGRPRIQAAAELAALLPSAART